mmetsp:Transcript_90208/g.232867  ORF Transcript_90208/g.232867 Transcript_90208/m.232867 type:complete len:792 (-) Transcript_90208:64-2439(-)
MSVHAVVEFALHFESFRNIDLFHQGIYHLKARLCEGNASADIGRVAKPSGCLGSPVTSLDAGAGAGAKASSAVRTDHHSLIPAYINEEQSSFSTRSFLIRYCEEEVEINEIGLFRFELSADELELDPVFYLEVELMFADLSQSGGADRVGDIPDIGSVEFKGVSTQWFRLAGATRGLHEFTPLIFDEYHFCLANIAMHSSLLDLRLRQRPTPRVATLGSWAGPTPETVARSSEAGCRPAMLPGEPRTSVISSQREDPSAYTAMSLAESIFGNDAYAGPDQLLQLAEEFYQQHLDALLDSHVRIAEWSKFVRQTCLTPALYVAMQRPGEVDQHPAGQRQQNKSPSDSEGEDSQSSTQCTDACAVSGQNALMRRLWDLKAEAAVTPESVARHLALEINSIADRILDAWHCALDTMLLAPREVVMRLRVSWERQIAKRWDMTVVKDAIRDDVFVINRDELIGEEHERQADSVRKAGVSAQAGVAFEDLSLMPKIDARPVLFEQRYAARSGTSPPASLEADDFVPCAPKQYRGVHLFVLVHGFQGNSFDMRLMKNNLSLLYPDGIFLCSTCNEDNTEGDITEMGIRLAQEVVNYICDWCPGTALGRLSFIAHSMGGLITRAALPMLHEYANKMYTFISFSTSHLGIFQDKISLFNTGFWVLKKWRKSEFLQQISMTDHADPRETFLYKLSKSKGLEWFQNVCLVSSHADQYGPFQSARAEICSSWEGQPDKDAYMEMVRNIWGPVRPERVRRFDMNFVIPEGNLDSFIGRAAHIQFLECQPMMKMLVHNYSSLFR